MLNGIRVIEIGQAFSAPFGAEILGFLGAEVIKVERPGGDDTRHWGPDLKDGACMTFHLVNRNKKSVVLDLKDPDQVEKLLWLIGGADVFVHNLRPGSPEKLGIDGPTLMEKFPELIYGEVGAFGHTGPKSNDAGYEMLMQAFSGIMSITGEPGGEPVRAGPSLCDFGSGIWLALGVVTALNNRLRGGGGCIINTSIFEAALNWTSVMAGEYLGYGNAPQRAGNGHPVITPYGLYTTKDSGVILGVGNDRLFSDLAKALDRADLLDDDRFATNAARIENRALVEETIGEIFARETTAHWIDILTAAGVPVSPLQSVPEALEHPQTEALGILQTASDAPDTRFIGTPLSFNGKRPKLRHLAPKAGADTDEILSSLSQNQE